MNQKVFWIIKTQNNNYVSNVTYLDNGNRCVAYMVGNPIDATEFKSPVMASRTACELGLENFTIEEVTDLDEENSNEN